MTTFHGPIQQRWGTAADWTLANPVLLSGENGWESDTRKGKVGDGVTAWNDLDYHGYAPLDSPAFTGDPTAPTQPAGDNSDKIATTAHVKDQAFARWEDGDPLNAAPETSIVVGGGGADVASAGVYGAISAEEAIISDVGAPVGPTDAATKGYVDDEISDLIAGMVIDVQVFTAAGTWTKPAGALYVVAEVQGGSAAGGGVPTTAAGVVATGGGGGGGGYARKHFAASALGATEAVAVGAAGVGAANATGGSGGPSSFDAVSATGGTGGTAGTAFTPPSSANGVGGAGGVGSGGDVNIAGARGGDGFALTTTRMIAGLGGKSVLSNGDNLRIQSGTTSNAAGTNYGGGGMGAVAGASNGANVAGANGAPGIVIVTTYCAG